MTDIKQARSRLEGVAADPWMHESVRADIRTVLDDLDRLEADARIPKAEGADCATTHHACNCVLRQLESLQADALTSEEAVHLIYEANADLASHPMTPLNIKLRRIAATGGHSE